MLSDSDQDGQILSLVGVYNNGCKRLGCRQVPRPALDGIGRMDVELQSKHP